MSDPIQTVSVTTGGLAWLAGGVIVGASAIAWAVWWLAEQFRQFRKSITDLEKIITAVASEGRQHAVVADTRLGQHSERMTQLDARLAELERWRLRHVEDHE